MVHWNQVELKLALLQVASRFGIKGDIEIDDGTSFSYRIMMFFPQQFQEQVLQSQFAPYDAVAGLDEQPGA
jgi:hypothetical protein